MQRHYQQILSGAAIRHVTGIVICFYVETGLQLKPLRDIYQQQLLLSNYIHML